MATLREVLAAMSPEDQTAFLERLKRENAYSEQVAAHPILRRAEALGGGAVEGLGNALFGLATSPAAITNAFGLTNVEAPRRKLLGEGGYLASSPELGLDVGPWSGVGNVLGFAASFLGGGGEAKVGASLLERAAVGAAKLGAGTALRTPGDVTERLTAGAEAAPLGATLGIASLPRAAGQSLGKYIFSQSLRTGLAGAVTPGVSPVTVTDIPAVDNFIFNAVFGAVSSVRATEPKVPGREPAQNAEAPPAAIDADLRARAGDMQRSLEDQAKLEQGLTLQFPDRMSAGPGPTNLFGETQGTQRSLFEPQPPIEPGTLVPDNVQQRLFTEAQPVGRTLPEELFPETPPPTAKPPTGAAGPSLVNRLKNLSDTTVMKLVDGLSVDKYVQSGKEAPPAAVSARADIEQRVRDELSKTAVSAWNPNKSLRVIIAAPRFNESAESGYGAMMYPALNMLLLPPEYFKRSLTQAGATLIHEAAHEGSMNRNFKRVPVDELAGLFNKAGYPTVVVPRGVLKPEQEQAVATELATQIVNLHFPGATLQNVVPLGEGSYRLNALPNALRNGQPISVPFNSGTSWEQPIVATDQTSDIHRSNLFSRIRFGNAFSSDLERAVSVAPRMGNLTSSGSLYAYTSPTEFVSELAAERATLSPATFIQKHGVAAAKLLDRVLGGPEASYVHGVTPAYTTQRPLLPGFDTKTAVETGGPRAFTIEWRPVHKDMFDVLAAHDYAVAFAEAGNDHPWSLALTRPANRSIDAPKHFTSKTTAAEAIAYSITARSLRLLKRFIPAKASGAFDKIVADVRSLIETRAIEKDAEGPLRSKIEEKDLFTLVNIGDVKAIANEHMATAAIERPVGGTTPSGKVITIESFSSEQAQAAIVDLGTKKLKANVAATDYSAQFKERLDPVKEARLSALSKGGLLGLMENSSLDMTMKQILARRFPSMFLKPDGTPPYPQQQSITSIARSLGQTERNIRARIQSFAASGLSAYRLRIQDANPVDIKQPPLFEGIAPATKPPDLPPTSDNNLVRGGVIIPTDDPTYDYVVWKQKMVQIDRATGEPVVSSVVSRRGTGRTAITDLKTGRRTVQYGLFDDRRAAFTEADREAARIEPVLAEPPTPLTREDTVIQNAVGEAETGPLATAALKGNEAAQDTTRRSGIKPPPPLFADIAGAYKAGSRMSEFLTFEKARARIGTSAMTDDQFASLHLDQQLRHTILRLSDAANSTIYNRTLAKYSRLLNAHASESGTKVPFPTLDALAKLIETKGGKAKPKIAPREGWMKILNARAAELGVDLGQANPEKGAAARLRLTEPETGRQLVTRDVGTAALFLDARSRRLAEAIDLMPPGFNHLHIYLDPAGGAPYGPPPPIDTGPDAESGGRPPDFPADATRSYGDAFWSQARPTLPYAAHITEKFKDPEWALATRNLMNAYERGRNDAQRTIQRRVDLAKRHGVGLRRQEAIGNAAADVDVAGQAVLDATKDLNAAIAHIHAVQDSIYAAHGLPSNEVAFLHDMRPEWDRLFRLAKIGITKYIPGYFARWRPSVPENGTVILDATHTTDVSFFARMERRGLLRGRSYKYFEVYDHYARQLFREKAVATSPGAGILSPIERMDSIVQRYALRNVKGEIASYIDLTDDAGKSVGRTTKQFEPFVRLMQIARGLPDTRRSNAVEAQAGITKYFYDRTGDRLQAQIDKAYVPFRKDLSKVVRAFHDSLGVKLSERSHDTFLDLFTRLSRGRTFGLHFGKALRNMITDGPFQTLPRVGPKYYAQAVSDLLNPAISPHIYARAKANGVIKPAQVLEYASSTNRAINWIEKLSFMFTLSDHWGRAVAFHAQELKTRDATIAYRTTNDLEKFKHDSGLTLLDPAWHPLVIDPLLRGNFPVAIREHAKLLADIALFDYTNANAPIAFRGMWGRFFGQYSIWPINMIESFLGMIRWGTREERLKQAALYAASAAAVYGLGSAIGVKTSQWIPFINNVIYTGGPGLGLSMEVQEALAGDPGTQDRLISDLRHDPVAFFLGPITKNILPAGDVLRVLAAQTNMDRRRRRLLGVPRPDSSPAARIKRLLGFIPAEAPPPKTQPLADRALRALTNKLP